MNMTPRLRKFALTAHVTSSVGWLGAVVAYLALAIAALTSRDAQLASGAFLAMELTGWFVIVPFGLAALGTGLVQSFGTEWGLFRHYWILAKFVLTVGGITIMLMHMPAVSRMAGVAAAPGFLSAKVATLGHPTFVVHAGGGLLVLLAATALSIYKPWGRTPFGLPKESEPIQVSRPAARSTNGKNWKLYVLFGFIALTLLFVILHLVGGGLGKH